MVFALWSKLGGYGAPGLELAYNVASEAEVQATLDERARAGGTILRQATLAVWGGTSGAFADVDGYVWGVAYNPGWSLLEDGSVHL